MITATATCAGCSQNIDPTAEGVVYDEVLEIIRRQTVRIAYCGGCAPTAVLYSQPSTNDTAPSDGQE